MIDDSMPAGVARAVWEVCAGVPGLSLMGLSTHLRPADGVPMLKGAFRGWSPSLHACAIAWEVEEAAGSWNAARHAADAFRPFARSQALRAERALAHRIGLPLNAYRAPVGHLHADASHVAMLLQDFVEERGQAERRRNGDDDFDDAPEPNRSWRAEEAGVTIQMMRNISAHAALAHSDERPHDGGAVYHNSGVAVAEIDGRSVTSMSSTSRDLGKGNRVLVSSDTRCRTRVHVGGVDRNLPDTVVAALPGRRLGQVVATDPLLDERTIATAHVNATGLHVTLEPVLVRLGAIDGLRPSSALRILEDRIRPCAHAA